QGIAGSGPYRSHPLPASKRSVPQGAGLFTVRLSSGSGLEGSGLPQSGSSPSGLTRGVFVSGSIANALGSGPRVTIGGRGAFSDPLMDPLPHSLPSRGREAKEP